MIVLMDECGRTASFAAAITMVTMCPLFTQGETFVQLISLSHTDMNS